MADHEHKHDETEVSDEQALLDFRVEKDEYMADYSSPLTDEQRDAFSGLVYYPFNPALRFVAAVEKAANTDKVTMATSGGSEQVYRRLGKIHFTVNDQPAELTVYSDEFGDLFLPIRDATSGKETYGAGRYIEPDLMSDGTLLVDFNYLYNPYCAYNDAWSCPLPPTENWLRLPIEAGEKSFHE